MTLKDQGDDAQLDSTIRLQDLIDVLKGRANKSQARRVAEALEDSSSLPSQWLAELSRISNELPGHNERRSAEPVQHSSDVFAELQVLQRFVDSKHASGDISDDEFRSISSVLRPDEKLTQVQAHLAKKKLLDAIVSTHPDFEMELRELIVSRHR